MLQTQRMWRSVADNVTETISLKVFNSSYLNSVCQGPSGTEKCFGEGRYRNITFTMCMSMWTFLYTYQTVDEEELEDVQQHTAQ